MNHIEGQNRDQMFITSLDQMVHPQAFVRIIDAIVDALDFRKFKFKHVSLNADGHPPFHPAVMMKLYLYGYHYGPRSCRKLERAAQTDVEVMWLLKYRRPHYKTIANFRKDNPKAFRDALRLRSAQVFRHFVFILKEWNLIDGKHVAIDSFKVWAQNSLKNNYNQKKIQQHLDYIDDKINNYEESLEASEDEVEQEVLQEKINDQVQKWNHYTELEEELVRREEAQISTTDPDSKAVILHRNIINVGYNIQAASDSKHKLLVAMDTGTVNDTHSLANMVERVQKNISKQTMNVLADKGYHTGGELAACEALGVKTFVSPRANAATKQYPVFPMEAFKYHPGTDTYRCPAGELLRTNGKWYERRNRKQEPIRFKHYKTDACKSCPLRNQCTGSRNGRVIQRTEYQSAIDRNNKRVNSNPDYYRQRQQIIEHQFGTFKRQWNFDHVLMRGKGKVLGEISLLFTAYNLRRSMSILGFSGMIERLKALFSVIFEKMIAWCRMMDQGMEINCRSVVHQAA